MKAVNRRMPLMRKLVAGLQGLCLGVLTRLVSHREEHAWPKVGFLLEGLPIFVGASKVFEHLPAWLLLKLPWAAYRPGKTPI